MESIKERLEKINTELLGKDVQLVAVSKTKPISDLMEAYDSGVRVFGENKVQEMVEKYEKMPKNIKWHFIGHLQTNKVKQIASFVSLIHSVDSERLLLEINKRATECKRIIPCLLQVHIAQEETKFGFSEEELFKMVRSATFSEARSVNIVGLMGMASNTDNETQIRSEFRKLKKIHKFLKTNFLTPNMSIFEVSMGMSSDYKIAIEEGSTMIRLGSTIFGSR